MEEFVGKIWHRWITQSAHQRYPEAAVELDDIRHRIAIFFRALGGEGGLRIEDTLETDHKARRSLLQRIAGTGKKTELAWRDEETLRLPHCLDLFPEKVLNNDLYLWLAAISAVTIDQSDWLTENRQRTLKTLAQWPGLKKRYDQLVKAHIAQRTQPEALSSPESAQERMIRQALIFPHEPVQLPSTHLAIQPVPLWLHPTPPPMDTGSIHARQDPDHPESSQNKDQRKTKKRKQANRAEMPDGKDGLISFRLESLWSWAEYVKVDRNAMDDDDDEAMRTAEDMDHITVASDSETTASKIKLDLDLPAGEYDDIVLGEGIPVDEWDYQQQRLQKAHCRLQPMVARHTEASELPKKLHAQARKIRRHFEMLRPQRHWVSRQNEGTELDLDNYIHFMADRKQGYVNSDIPVYRALKHQTRDLSCLLLADLSLSTDAYVNNHSRVIDVIRDSLYLFSEALMATGDRFALHGFSSRNRNHVRFYHIKTFQDRYDNLTRGHIDAIRPGYYTRMGTAIRHASALLAKESSSQKLLLILTDGKPNDLDKYEGRYGIEDTRMAVLEAEKMGLRPFCVTIDEQAEDYLPYLFGKRSYVFIRHAEELPRKLPLLYLRLTS